MVWHAFHRVPPLSAGGHVMKAKKLIHPSHAREVLSEQDAKRLRDIGWLELADAKPVGKSAAWQRRFRQRCAEQGFKQFTVWLPAKTFSALAAMKKPGETFAELIERITE